MAASAPSKAQAEMDAKMRLLDVKPSAPTSRRHIPQFTKQSLILVAEAINIICEFTEQFQDDNDIANMIKNIRQIADMMYDYSAGGWYEEALFWYDFKEDVGAETTPGPHPLNRTLHDMIITSDMDWSPVYHEDETEETEEETKNPQTPLSPYLNGSLTRSHSNSSNKSNNAIESLDDSILIVDDLDESPPGLTNPTTDESSFSSSTPESSFSSSAESSPILTNTDDPSFSSSSESSFALTNTDDPSYSSTSDAPSQKMPSLYLSSDSSEAPPDNETPPLTESDTSFSGTPSLTGNSSSSVSDANLLEAATEMLNPDSEATIEEIRRMLQMLNTRINSSVSSKHTD